MNNGGTHDHGAHGDDVEEAKKSAPKSPVIKEESAFSQRFTCDIDFNPFKPGAHLSVPLSASNSGHEWLLTLSFLTRYQFRLEFGPLKDFGGLHADNARIFVSVAQISKDGQEPALLDSKYCCVDTLPWKSDSKFTLKVSGTTRDDRRYGIYDSGSNSPHDCPKQYRIIIEYKGVISDSSLPSAREAAVARRMTISTSPGYRDICLSFPRDIKIWVDSAQLSALSPFFKDCLASGFSEGEARVNTGTLEQMNGEGEPSTKKRKTVDDFDDSDDESDQTLKTHGKLPDYTSSSYPFHVIPITQAASVTYQATLTWQQTGFVRFAPLTSSFLNMTAADPIPSEVTRKQQQDETRRIAESDPSLPHPVSSKSLYRLAHFLSIPELQKLALSAFFHLLTPQGAIYEFLSHEASCYPEIRKVVLDYIVKHSQIVVKSPGYDGMMRSIESGNTRYALLLPTLFEALSSSLPAKVKDFSTVDEKYPMAGMYGSVRLSGEAFP